MNIPLIGFVIVLAVAGLQTVRLANTEADWAKEREHLATVAQTAITKNRELEQKLGTANMENANEQARLKTDAARRIAAADRAAAGLRDTIYALGRRERPATPEAAGWFDAATTARRLVGECSGRRLEVAAAAHELRTQVTGLQRYVNEVCLAEQ